MDLEIILLVAAILGGILSTILMIKKNTNKVSTLFLCAFYIIFSIYCFQTYIIESGNLKFISWFYGWPLILYSLTPITVYFYFKSVMNDQFNWKTKHLFLFIPFMLCCIDVLLLYLKSSSDYNQIIHNAIVHPNERFEAKYGIFKLLHHYTLRHFLLLICLLLLLNPLKKFIYRKTKEELKKILNSWLLLFFIVIFIIALLSTILGVEEIFDVTIFGFFFKTKQIYSTLIFVTYLIALIIGVVPLYFPSILYGYPQTIQKVAFANKPNENQENSREKYGLDEVDILKKLELVLSKELYLQRNFDLNQLSVLLEIPVHHISYFLNQYYKLSFTSYRNQLRMEYAKKMIHSGFLETNTIEALTWKCGFASRSAFTKTFKAYTGVNPSEYISKDNQQ